MQAHRLSWLGFLRDSTKWNAAAISLNDVVDDLSWIRRNSRAAVQSDLERLLELPQTTSDRLARQLQTETHIAVTRGGDGTVTIGFSPTDEIVVCSFAAGRMLPLPR